jgi:hypothetical protein
MEPERPIEKLVRKAGERRLAESKGGFELHPATRRMLQGEAQRLHGGRKGGQERDASPRTSWLASFGWSFGVFAGVVLAALLMWPREKGYEMAAAKQPAGRTLFDTATRREAPTKMLSRDSVAVTELSAPAAATANERRAADDRAPTADDLTPPLRTSEPLALDSKLALKDEAKSANREREFAPADKPAQRQPRVQMQATAGAGAASPAAPSEALVEQPKAAVANTTANFASASPPSGSVAADGAEVFSQNAPAVAKQVAREDDKRTKERSGAGIDSVRFAQKEETDSLKRASAKAETVLTTFSLQHEGDWLKVVDGDGSVYTGQVQNVAATTALSVAAGPKAYRAFGGAQFKASERQTETVAPPAAAPVWPQWHFMVHGTNRSLNKEVTFHGQLLFTSSAAPPQTNVYYFGGAPPALTNAFSVSGEARIGTRSLKIEAERQH